MSKILNIIKSYFNRYKIFIYLSLALLAVILVINIIHRVQENRKIKKQLQVSEFNLSVMQDSLRIVKDKIQKDEFNKLAFLTDKVSNLSKLSQDLAEEIKTIKGNVNTVIKTDVKIVEKPVPFLVNTSVKDSVVTVYFKLDTSYSKGNYKKISGYTEYNTVTGDVKSQKLEDEVGLKLITGIKNLDQGKPEIFLKSDYPGLTITSIEGAVIDPTLFSSKKKTPLITPGITIGWTPVTWNNSTQKLALQPTGVGITAGLSFNILKLLGFKK